MPGESGSKVKCSNQVIQNLHLRCVLCWEEEKKQNSWQLLIYMKLFVTVLSSGWQRFRRPPWSSWRKGTQSEYEERTCGFWGQPSLETAVRFLKYKPTISYNSSPSSSTFCSLSSVPSPHWLQHQGLLVVQRAPPIHLTDMPVVADVNAKPGKLIWPFDPVTRGGTDSRPTGAAFNLALDDQWWVLSLVFVEFGPV